MVARVEAVGFEQIQRMLRELPAPYVRRVVTGGLRGAAQPVRLRARQLAPVSPESNEHNKPGSLRRSIRVAQTKFKRRRNNPIRVPVVQVIAGPRPKDAGKFRPFYAQFVERGTERTGAVPYLEPAFRQTTGQQRTGVMRGAGRAAIQVIKSLEKKYNRVKGNR